MAVYLGNELVLANGVAGTSLVNGHAATHAAGGGDEVTPASIGAAPAAHTHAEYAEKPVSLVLTLPLSGWTRYTYSCVQTVAVTGMRSGRFTLISPAPDSWYDYVEVNARCTVQGYDALTFSTDRMPVNDMEVNVLMWG